MWDFETDPEYQADLDWADQFVRNEVEPLQYVLPHALERAHPIWQALVPPLQQEVRARGLWATHLGPDLGGPGHGQVKLALLNEILGRTPMAPIVFGCQAPDSGNAEIIAHYGTDELKERYLRPLLDGQMFSCFSMTEPQGGSDPKEFTCSAVLDGEEWVINGEKWFSSNARYSEFLIVMVVTEPDNPPYQRQSMIIVPSDTPGINILRNVGHSFGSRSGEGTHAYIRYENVRVPKDNLLGGRGNAFVVAQTRLGGGRIHHAMRTVGMAQRALDMMLERAVSRRTQGELLSKKQLVQETVAESWIELEQFRLLVLRTAWRIDKYKDYKRVRGDISAVKVAMPGVLHRIASRALQVHGSLGITEEMPFMSMISNAYHLGLADGPTEVHKVTLARTLLSQVKPADGLFPTMHVPAERDAALAKYAPVLAELGLDAAEL
jgi:acyl-CoA dehydrogenase